MNQKRMQTFASVYSTKLVEAMKRDPTAYLDTPATAPDLALRMTISLANGTASLGNAAKAAARSLGIKPTLGAIRAYLQGQYA